MSIKEKDMGSNKKKFEVKWIDGIIIYVFQDGINS